jgi:hypothetical protein
MLLDDSILPLLFEKHVGRLVLDCFNTDLNA